MSKKTLALACLYRQINVGRSSTERGRGSGVVRSLHGSLIYSTSDPTGLCQNAAVQPQVRTDVAGAKTTDSVSRIAPKEYFPRARTAPAPSSFSLARSTENR